VPSNAAPDPADTGVARRSAFRFGARTVLIAVAMALLSVPFALLLVLVEDKWPPLARVDAGARDGLYRYAVDHPLFVSVMKTLSAIGSTIVYVVALAATAVWLLWRRLPRLAVFAVVTVWGGVLLNNLVKIAVHRARPVLLNPVAHAAGQSFPSGHAQSAVVAYGVLLVVFLSVRYGPWRRLAMAAAALMVLAIGFSRIALGVHYASDVLAGYLLGAAWVAAMTAAFNAWRVERGDSEQQAPDGHAPRLQ
jgi:undecaprenyl-diphosphatase